MDKLDFKAGDHVKIIGNPVMATICLDGLVGTVIEIFLESLLVHISEPGFEVAPLWYIKKKDVMYIESRDGEVLVAKKPTKHHIT